MLTSTETTSLSTIVSLSSVSSASERETEPLPSLSVDPDEYVWMSMSGFGSAKRLATVFPLCSSRAILQHAKPMQKWRNMTQMARTSF